MWKIRCAIFILSITCLMTGCGENRQLPTHPVSGKLTLDGKPVSGGEIWLVPTETNTAVKNAAMTIRPYTKTKSDGTFVVTSYMPDDVAPLGDYAVMVVVERASGETAEDLETDTPADPKARARRQMPFPVKYTDPTTSGLTFTVKKGPNQLDLALKSK